MIRTLKIALTVGLLLASLGCPAKTGEAGKTGAAKSDSADEPGGSSPEDLWKKLKATEKEGGDMDMKAMTELCTEASQGEFAQFGMMAAGFASMGKNMKADPAKEKLLNELLDKHGVNRGPDGKAANAKEALKDVKDMPALVSDLFAFADKHGSGKSSNSGMGTLKEIKTSGDRATATVTKKGKDGKETTEACVFLKEKGRWFFDLKETTKATKALKKTK
ncbi:MAG: DUF4878 domain-containing protein [Planctomycetes bacterium]|nr:DUF4878 domain-containing protein [Planctomycetota bacterium]